MKVKLFVENISVLTLSRKSDAVVTGLKQIHTSSADEAYKLLMIGQSNLRVACTNLNHNSSRRYSSVVWSCVALVSKPLTQVAVTLNDMPYWTWAVCCFGLRVVLLCSVLDENLCFSDCFFFLVIKTYFTMLANV